MPSRSQSPKSASPSFSDSENRLSPSSENQETIGPSSSRAGSAVPQPMENIDDSVTCLWEDCGIIFTHLPTLINHIHNGESLVYIFLRVEELGTLSGGDVGIFPEEVVPIQWRVVLNATAKERISIAFILMNFIAVLASPSNNYPV